MKKSFYRQIVSATAVSATALLFAGCFGAGVQSGVEVGTTNNYFGSGPTASEVKEESAKPLPKTEKIVLLNNQRDLLKLSVKSEGNNSDEKALAADIVQQTQGALSSDDAKIVTDGKYDVTLTIRPKLTVVDQDGDYYRMNCDVNVEMKSADGRRIFGSKKIEIAAPRRVLGKDAAISKLAEPAATNTAEWSRKELTRLANEEVGATRISVQLPTVSEGETRNAQKDAANIKAIGDNLAKLPNLISYELVGQDPQTGVCEYRVVYFISKYPNGIANEVSALVSSVKQN